MLENMTTSAFLLNSGRSLEASPRLDEMSGIARDVLISTTTSTEPIDLKKSSNGDLCTGKHREYIEKKGFHVCGH